MFGKLRMRAQAIRIDQSDWLTIGIARHMETQVQVIASLSAPFVCFLLVELDMDHMVRIAEGFPQFFTPLRIKKTIQFSDTNPHTISVRVGVPNNSYPISINGTSARILGGAVTSSLILTEYAV